MNTATTNNNNIQYPSSAAQQQQTRGKLEITVSDPVKQGDGSIQAFVSYKITTITDLPQYEQPQFFQIRRYSDFLWLREQLVRDHPGVIIPPLPEKLVVGRFAEEFVEARRRSLEKFLCRIAAHPIMRENRHFKAFLEASEEAFTATKESTQSSSKGFWQWAAEAGASLTTKIGGNSSSNSSSGAGNSSSSSSSSSDHHETTPEDVQFEEVRRYIDGFEPQIQNVHKHSLGLIKRNREMANGLFEFGLAFTLLGQSETDSLGNALSQLGHCADKISVLAAEEADKEVLFFEEPIRDYVRLVDAVKQTLDVRTQKVVQYENAVSEYTQKLAAHQKLLSQGVRDNRVALSEQEVSSALAAKDAAKIERDEVTARVLSEIKRFKEEKLVDFKAIVLDFVQLQIDHNRKVEESWRAVLPDLQSINVADSAAASTPGAAATTSSFGLPPPLWPSATNSTNTGSYSTANITTTTTTTTTNVNATNKTGMTSSMMSDGDD